MQEMRRTIICLLALFVVVQAFAQLTVSKGKGPKVLFTALTAPTVQTPMTAVSKVAGIKFVDSTDYDRSQFSFINNGSQRMTAFHCRLTTNLADGRSEQQDETGEMLFFELAWKAETRVRPWMKPQENRHFIAPGEKITITIPHMEIPAVVSAAVLCDVAVFEDGTAESANDVALRAIINRRTEMAKQETQLIQAATTIQAQGKSVADLHQYARANVKDGLLEYELTNLENGKSLWGGEHTAKTDSDRVAHFIVDHKMRAQAWTKASKIAAVNQ